MGDSQLRSAADRGATATAGAARDFFAGAGLLARGLGLVLRSPRLLGLGLLPALLAGLLYAAAVITLIAFVDDLAAAVTWFADDWSAFWRGLVRVVAGAALLGLGGLLSVLTFTAVTLLIGDPFYEKISGLVEHRYGGVPDEVEVPLLASLGRSLRDSLRLIGLSVLLGLPLFVAGFIPVVGQTVVPVLGGAVAGWLLAVELTGVPFQRRDKRLRDRRAALRARRPLALGFGVAVFACFLIPLGAVLLMPAAVAGGTLLSRKVLGLPTEVVTTPSL
ncbi:membrane protein [Actinoplanes sp. NBRC 14428]|uniref:CysZ protein n=1 Tax=Pseudosporangium ferrugineum TaxID=439699 RepID=A0A2T0S5P4_9ACTN|nr:EI24 domain-containing protein [Pseudosporangium ferrugineum]PRY28757.1 CysZ protein [Pseudosporangium ferrugineum]BCJ53782.1 membrane protein [Actinoplanes sp. NBRC 14428]